MEGVASECPLFRGKNVRCRAVGTEKSVRCPKFRGGRFSEVANVLHKRDFQSVTGTLSALGSVSASRSVRSGRFYCMSYNDVCCESYQFTCDNGDCVSSDNECDDSDDCEWYVYSIIMSH